MSEEIDRAYDIGYEKGARAVIDAVSNWLDDDTVDELKARFLGDGGGMRELKFRAFDTENKTWTFVTLGDLICGACTENGDKPLSGAKQIWEQYTGLKDKNGKEIYGGDILRWKHYYTVTGEHKEYTERVYWEEKDACYVVGDWFESLGSLVYEDAVELIGNIHENPELLAKEEE